MRELNWQECGLVCGGYQDSGYQDSGTAGYVSSGSSGDSGNSGQGAGGSQGSSSSQDAGGLYTHGTTGGIKKFVMEMAGDQLSQFFSSLQEDVRRIGPNTQDSGNDHDNPENTGPIDPGFADFITEYGNPSSLDRMPESHYWDFLTQGIDAEFQATAVGPRELRVNYSGGQMTVSSDQNYSNNGNFDGSTAHFNVNGLDLIGTFHASGTYHSGTIDPDTGKLDVVVTAGNGALTHWTFDVDPSHAPGDPWSNLISNGIGSSGENASADSFPSSASRRESLGPYLDKPHMKEGEARHLTDGEKAALKDFYGDTLTDAQMNSVILRSGGQAGDASATTWGKNDIRFNTKVAITDYSTDNSTMALLVHEFAHVIQWNSGYSTLRFGWDELAGATANALHNMDIYSYDQQTFQQLMSGKIHFGDLNIETQAALKEDSFRAQHNLPTLGNDGFTPDISEYKSIQTFYNS